MPTHLDIWSAEGQILKINSPAEVPGDFPFVRDCFMGEAQRIIGAQMQVDDMSGIVHLIQDPEAILAVSSGLDVSEFINDNTAVAEVIAECRPVQIPFTTTRGYLGFVAIYHTLPATPAVYN